MSDIQRYAFTKDSMVACCCSVDACTDGDYMLYDTHKMKVSALQGALFQRDKKIEKLEERVQGLEDALLGQPLNDVPD